MFKRKAIIGLKKWKNRKDRKPLILRGARQVGKTTIVNMFSEEFEQYIYLNLENKNDRRLFRENLTINELIDSIFYYKKKTKKETLIFIDEIQHSAEAVRQLRYFYEERKDLYIIAAGSLLDVILDDKTSFPVGRVEFMAIRSCDFEEFLGAMGENQSLEIMNTIPFPVYAHDNLIKLFHLYSLIGGMPEIISHYSEHKDLVSLEHIYESLVASYFDDIEKYAKNSTMSRIIRHVMEHSFYEAGSRIKFEGFGNSQYKNREMREAFRVLEKAYVLQLVYPVTTTKLPLQPNVRRSPKLQLLDTGLVNYFVGLQKDVFGAKMLSDVYEGKIAEHIAGQEILSLKNSVLYKLHYWTREKANATSEVDYVWQHENKIIPIEVKAGASGKLKSLHQFILRSPHKFAIRIYSGELSIDKVKTVDRKEEFILLNLPFYLINKIDEYIGLYHL